MRQGIALLPILACLLAVTVYVFAPAEPVKDSPRSVFYKPVPTDLANEVAQGMGLLSKKYSVDQEGVEAVRGTVNSVRLGAPVPDPLRENVLRVGRGAIPVIADMLLSQDDVLRRKAMEVLRVFAMPPVRLVVKYGRFDDIRPHLIALDRRCLCDRDVDVRIAALGHLTSMAYGHRPSRIHPSILRALQEADCDPHPRMRAELKMAKQWLRLIPRQPGDPYYD